MLDPAQGKDLLRRLAEEQGFAAVGVAPAGPSDRAERFDRFLRNGYQADMHWLARTPEKRVDPRCLLEGARSVICLAASYAPRPGEDDPGGQEPACPAAVVPAKSHGSRASPPARTACGIARYARGRDYHRLLRNLCRRLLARLEEHCPGLPTRRAGSGPGGRFRVCVDAAPLLERDLAAAAGLGWIGRNGCVIHPRLGSYLLLAEIVTDLPLQPDAPVENRCAGCRACVAACPTGAIQPDGLVDSRRCLSYLSIEHRAGILRRHRPAMGGRLFGCDACQAACPHNRRVPAGLAELVALTPLANVRPAEVLTWTYQDWDCLTRGSAGRRAGHAMYQRNAAIAAGNARDASCRPALEALAAGGDPTVADAARWALERLDEPRPA